MLSVVTFAVYAVMIVTCSRGILGVFVVGSAAYVWWICAFLERYAHTHSHSEHQAASDNIAHNLSEQQSKFGYEYQGYKAEVGMLYAAVDYCLRHIFLGICDAAEALGFRTLGAKLTWEQFRSDAHMPCIVHWNQQHFVVVTGISKGCVLDSQ